MQELENKIIELFGDDGLWRGHLSSSAISTSVACFALMFNGDAQDDEIICKAVRWLELNQNSDGGWGDSSESPTNITATLLAYACITFASNEKNINSHAVNEAAICLKKSIGTLTAANIRNAVLEKYETDLTFSVPILVISAIAGVLDESILKNLPRLPFEAALFPQKIYRFLNLPVVSYAIPALIAVGLAQHCAVKDKSIFRRITAPLVLKKLQTIQPSHGGFLDAPPLTGFTAACLIYAGYKNHEVVIKAVNFLRNSFRADGSCAIDSDLSIWLTCKTVKSLADSSFLKDEDNREKVCRAILGAQFSDIHPFTGAIPGGWGWTDSPGAVPDSDDTSAALIALHILQKGKINDQVEAAVNWLLKLQNMDGGIPTFCKGWGKLPFDRSCPDITAHALEALSLWQKKSVHKKSIRKAMTAMIRYLEKSQNNDGSWLPLWFGDQNTENQNAKVYGTSVVIVSAYQLLNTMCLQNAVNYLISSQNSDGSWGGDAGVPGSREYTGVALKALKTAGIQGEPIIRAQNALSNMDYKPSPIGLYFASLWYSELMYPLIFSS